MRDKPEVPERIPYMSHNERWDAFMQSGKVEDYLNYVSCKDTGVQAEDADAQQDQGDNYQGTERQGE